MSDIAEAGLRFQRSTFCGPAGCVEVAAQSADLFLVRDAKNSGSPTLSFDRVEWNAFLAGVLAGEFSPESLLQAGS